MKRAHSSLAGSVRVAADLTRRAEASTAAGPTCRRSVSSATAAAAAAPAATATTTRTAPLLPTQQPAPSDARGLHRWLLALLAGGTLVVWLAPDGWRIAAAAAADDNGASSSKAKEASSGSGDKHSGSDKGGAGDGNGPAVVAVEKDAEGHHDFSHVQRDLDADFFDADQFKLNDEGQVEWMSTSTRPRIVVLGTGWGSVSFLKGLDINHYEIVVVSPRNYFLFTPLLPSACTGTLEMGSLTEPIRQILLSRHHTHQSQYVEAKAVALDRENRKVQCVDNNGRSFLIQYDHLIVGVGANNNTFNTPGVKDHAFFLKEAKHARLVRSKILSHFERAASPTTSLAEKEALLQFVVVGGGPTGVEFAGELIDFLDSDLSLQFPSLIPLVRVRLLQSQEHILNTYDQKISEYAAEKFKELRIQVITNARVQAITEDTITYLDKLSGRTRVIPFGVCLWSTGIEMNAFTRSLAEQVAGQEGKAVVTDDKLRMLLAIPELDRMPKRIVSQAAEVLAGKPKPAGAARPAAAQPTAAAAPAASVPASDASAQPASAVAPATMGAKSDEDAPRDLLVDPRIYVLGDCATTYVPKLSRRIKLIFEAADRDQDGYLSFHELRELCATLSYQFPVMSAQMSMVMARYDEFDVQHPERGISMDELRTLLDKADKHVRVYPATAQVAAQQGKYLARRFNQYARQQHLADRNRGLDHLQLAHVADPASVPTLLSSRPSHPPIELPEVADRPFRYKHLGSLAYIGGETAAIDLGDVGVFTGWTAFWLWKSAYLSEAVSTRTRLNLAYDWFVTFSPLLQLASSLYWAKTFFFGRDTSKP